MKGGLGVRVEELQLGQHISCVYMISRGLGCVNGTIYKITPKTFVVNVKTKLVTIKKASSITLKLFDSEPMK